MKKKFPSLKKSIKKFLTDESGKITKKDALGLSAGTFVLASPEELSAAIHGSTFTPTTNPPGANPYPEFSHPTDYSEIPRNGSATDTWTVVNSATCNHASGIVNGHFSNTPSVNIASEQIDFTQTHSSHGSHGNHESGGWC